MKNKLTLSLPSETILHAKRIAKERQTSVSRLFEWVIDSELSAHHNRSVDILRVQPELRKLTGILRATPPFDARSVQIRKKHG